MPEVPYPLATNATDRDRVDTITLAKSGGDFLDYGGGLGTTAIEASQRGFRTTVIEDSALAVEKGRLFHPGITWIKANSIREIAGESYDVVSLFHVLEHIVDLSPFLKDLNRVVRPEGFAVIEVPNWGSGMRRLLGMNWLYLLDHHVNYFDCRTLAATMKRQGFRQVRVEYRRTFCINERQPSKELFKKILCALGFADILRVTFEKTLPDVGL